MNQDPFFSIIIPTYNRASWVKIAITSILDQGFTSFEILVVDDGSTDTTSEVVRRLASTDNRIVYLPKVNEERSIARNYGIDRAKGAYVGFLDSDDYVLPNHLRAAFDLLDRHSFPEVCHLGYKFIDLSGNTVLVRNNFGADTRALLIQENVLHGNAIFIRREVIQHVKFIPSRDAILSEDWYVWLRLAARFPIHFDTKVTAIVTQHADRSLMNIDPAKLMVNTAIIIDNLRHDSVFLNFYGERVEEHFAAHYTFLTLILSLSRKFKKETIKYLFAAFNQCPRILLSKRFWASVKFMLIRW
jgi:glycosyltransferase involved in cell wall biosynthesis